MAKHEYSTKSDVLRSRGFARLRPEGLVAQEDETSKERMMREVREEAERRKARVIPDQPSVPKEQPSISPVGKPVTDLTEDPDPVIAAEARRKKGYKKLVP